MRQSRRLACIILCAVILPTGVIALGYFAAFSLWLSAHPNYDDALYRKRAILFGSAAALLIVADFLLGFLLIRSDRGSASHRHATRA